MNINNYIAPKNLLKDHVIVVTGAGQGLGRMTALQYAAHGATVILLGRKVAKLEAVYDEILVAKNPQPAIFPLDLEKATDAEFDAMALGIKQQYKRLDGILHSASTVPVLTPLANQKLDQWMTVLRVNLAAPFALTKACLPLLKHAPDGSVIFTSETHGHEPTADWGGFAVAKAGLETLTKIWAEECEMLPNLRINTFIPGPVASPQRSATHPGEVKSSMRTADSLAPYYLYLMGRDGRGLHGQTINATQTISITCVNN
jgi:NAD(P)-dependent dehydrogenase (short-subunit alcohol dehydrogenase family)